MTEEEMAKEEARAHDAAIERVVSAAEFDQIVKARLSNKWALDGRVLYIDERFEYRDGHMTMFAKLQHRDGSEVWYFFRSHR